MSLSLADDLEQKFPMNLKKRKDPFQILFLEFFEDRTRPAGPGRSTPDHWAPLFIS